MPDERRVPSRGEGTSENGRGPSSQATPGSAPAITEMTGVHGSFDGTSGAVPRIVVRDSTGKLLDFAVDWQRFGEIGASFAEALFAMKLRPATLAEKIRGVTIFLSWLALDMPEERPTALSRLRSNVFARYLAHVETGVGEDGQPHSVSTKRIRLGLVRQVMTKLSKSDKWKSRLADKWRLPANPWTGLKRRSKPRPLVPNDELRAIIMACTREIEATLKRHEEGRALIAAGRPQLREGMSRRLDFMEVEIALAAIEDWMGGYARDIAHVTESNWHLGQALVQHRVKTVFSYLYPDARTLVPFVILLAVHTAYNPAQLLGLTLGQIALDDLFSDQFRLEEPQRHNSRQSEDEPLQQNVRLRTAVRKDRAGGRVQYRSFRVDSNDPFSAYMLIESVRSLTGRIRPHAAAEDRNRLFIYHQSSRTPGVRTFGKEKKGIGGDGLWQYCLASFTQDNRLPKFMLASLRSTMADMAEQLTGDARAVQLLLGHAGTDVGFQHYFSAGARSRATESVAVAQGMRQRWAETDGRRDIRDHGPGDTLAAATPGMDCMDPYDSPMPGQSKGKLCSAYLGCLFCPLGVVRRNDPYSFARLVQLERHIQDGRATVPAERYRAAYMPLLPKIASRLETFTPEARAGASEISHLKFLPELE